MIMNKTCLILLILSSSSLNAMYKCYDNDTQLYSKYRNLVVAVQRDDYRLCKHLLEKIKVSPNAPDIRNRKPLTAPIVFAKTPDMAQLLIAHGARIPHDIVNYNNCTKNDYCCTLLNFYLKNGFEPFAKDAALHRLSRTCEQRKQESAERLANRIAKVWLLLQYGANPYELILKNDQCGTALHTGAQNKEADFCKLLLEFETMDQSTFLTFLMCCKRNFPRFYAQKDILRLLWNDLLSAKPLLAMKNSEGKTAWDYWPVDWLNPR